MTIIKTTSIDQTKVKTRWQEPYVSSSINRELSAIPRGVYRGFVVTQQSVPAKGISITIGSDSDSFLLHENADDGYKLAVRYDASFDLNFDFDASGGALTYYLWCDVVYAQSSQTAAYLKIGESADRDTNSVTICKISIPMGATTIINSYISQDSTDSNAITLPTPISGNNKYGLIDQTDYANIPTSDEKDALDGASPAASSSNPYATETATVKKIFAKTTVSSYALSAVSEFQITGKVYIGKGATGTASRYFGLFANNSGVPHTYEIGYVTNNQKFWVLEVYNSSNTAQLNPSSDADANGFYTNPYIHLSEAYTGTLWCQYSIESEYEDLNVGAIQDTAIGFRPTVNNDVMFQVEASRDRKPVTYTISEAGTGNYDFKGATALVAAMDAIEAGSADGGVIFVKDGSYTVTTSKTYNKAICILFEDTFNGATITFSHSSGYGLTFIGAVKIYGGQWTGAGKQLVNVVNKCDIQKATFTGQTRFTGVLSRISECSFSDYVLLIGYLYSSVENCYITAASNGLALDVDSCISTVIKNCIIDGSSGGTVDGEGISVHASKYVSVEDCYCSVRGTSKRGIRTYTNEGRILIRNCVLDCYSAYGGTTVGFVDFSISNADMSLVVDGLTVAIKHTSTMDATMLNLVLTSGAIGCDINISNLKLIGNGKLIAGSANFYEGSAISINVNSAAVNSNIVFDGVMITNFAHATAGYQQGVIIGSRVDNNTTRLTFKNTSIKKFAALAASENTYMLCFVTDPDTGGSGTITLDNCEFDGTGLTLNHTYTMYHYGIYAGSESMGVNQPNVMNILNCKFSNFNAAHIFQTDSGSQLGNTRYIIMGYNGYDDISFNAANVRIYFRTERMIISNSIYYRPTASPSGLTWLNQSWTGAGLQKIVIMGNSIWMANGASDFGIYIGDAVNNSTIIGNVGNTIISARNIDNHVGIGDGDYNTNALSVTLR